MGRPLPGDIQDEQGRHTSSDRSGTPGVPNDCRNEPTEGSAMPRVTFARDYDWQIPGKRGMIAFKAGWSGLVTTPQAEAARAAGVLRKETPRGRK